MRCALVLLANLVAVLAPACATRLPRVITPPAPVARAAVARDPAPARALASGCRAAPSTIYGNEPVVFEIQGAASTLPVDVALVDQQGQRVAQATAQVPGDWRPAAVPSGDFRLRVGLNGVSCTVTVNRELPRATPAPIR